MYITKAHFTNYRCFEDYTIEFASHVNILIGINGAGKSNVLSALHKALSFMFSKNEIGGAKVSSFDKFDTFFDGRERKFGTSVAIETWAMFEGQPINWVMQKENNEGKSGKSRIQSKLYQKALETVLNHYAQKGQPLMPVLVYYADAYPHIELNKGNVASETVRMDILPRNFAYYDWNEKTNCMPLWNSRYERMKQDVLDWKDKIKSNDSQKKDLIALAFEKELNFIEGKLKTFTAPLHGDEIPNSYAEKFQIARLGLYGGIEFVFENGSRMPFETLPQGYKRLFSIVLDLAFRCYTLNGAKRESGGIVFIDEVDLHLHPSLQQEVVQRFSRTFPNIQFILTTHSPLVLTNLRTSGDYAEKNRIIQLKVENEQYSNETVEGVYGIDYSTAVSEIMGAPARDSTVESFIQSYHTLKAEGYDEAAQRTEKQLAEYLGVTDLPQSIKDELSMYEND